MINKISRNDARKARHARIREKIKGTALLPRLCVFKSSSNIFAQLIDDTSGTTLASASSIDNELKLKNGGNIEAGQKVGELIAERAKKLNIVKVVFDRGGYLYHGRVKALADAARNNGLEF